MMDAEEPKRTVKGAMTPERLRVFLAVIEQGSISKAAAYLRKRQGQVSFQMKELEAFCGGALFERRGGVPRTPAGERLETLAVEFFKGLEVVKRVCQDCPQTIAVGAGESTIRSLLIPKLMELQQALPNARFVFEDEFGDVVLGKLATGKLDLGLLQRAPRQKSITSRRLPPLDYGVFARQDVAARVRGCNAKEFFVKYDWGFLEEGTRVGNALRKWASRLGVEPSVRLVCKSNLMLAEAVKSLELLAVLPELSVAGDSGIVRIDPPVNMAPWVEELSVPMHLIWSKRRNLFDPDFTKVVNAFERALS